VVRKNSVAHKPAQSSIHDAVRQESTWLGRPMTIRGDYDQLDAETLIVTLAMLMLRLVTRSP
jgi:hypothetical protein